MSLNANMNVKGGPTVAIKRVDQAKVSLKGQDKIVGEVGDVVKTAMDRISNPPSPRDPHGQSKVMSSKLPPGKQPKPTYLKAEGE